MFVHLSHFLLSHSYMVQHVKMNLELHVCVQKVGNQTNGGNYCQILTDFHNSFTAEKKIKFPTISIQYFPPHLIRIPLYLGTSNGSNLSQILFLVLKEF